MDVAGLEFWKGHESAGNQPCRGFALGMLVGKGPEAGACASETCYEIYDNASGKAWI